MAIAASTRELLTWDVVEAWKSNCPRLAVWDDAVTADIVTAARDRVALTERGAAALASPS